MKGGNKSGAQRACTLKAYMRRGDSPITATPIYHLPRYCDDTLDIYSRLHDPDILYAAEVSVFIDIHNKDDLHSFPGILG
jgi:hypothetical protein